jgi:hypothetical protein
MHYNLHLLFPKPLALLVRYAPIFLRHLVQIRHISYIYLVNSLLIELSNVAGSRGTARDLREGG